MDRLKSIISYTRIRFFKKNRSVHYIMQEYHQDICKDSTCSKCDAITKLNIFLIGEPNYW